MSRSFKKTPGFSDGGPKRLRFTKRQANKKVRRYKGDISNGSSYKLLYETWNIHDYNRRVYNEMQIRNYINVWNEERYKIFIK